MPDAVQYRDPNQPRSELKGPGSPSNNNDETDDIIKLVLDLFEQGSEARKGYDNSWDKRLDYYEGRQWSSDKRPSYKSRPVHNIIRSTIQSQLPLLTDNRPGFNVTPREPQDFSFSQIVGEVVEAWWDNSEMQHTIVQVLFDSMLYDAGILKVTWDIEAELGLGDIKCEVVDPRDIYVPYGAVDFDHDCPWVIHKATKTVGELKRRFPEFAEKIRPDSKSTDNNNNKAISQDIQLVSPTDKKGNNDVSTANGADQRKTATVYELWIRDDTIEEIKLADNDNNNNTMKKKYPLGRLITILPFSKVLLQDVPVPYMHGKWPFVRFVDMLLPRSFWGEGEVASLMDQQVIINKIIANILDYMTLMSNPIWISEAGNGVNPDKLTNAISAIIQTASGKKDTIKRDIPPALQSGMVEILQVFMRQAETVSGSTDVTQGRNPTGVSAAAAIQSLQEASQTRIRLKERNLATSLSQLGNQIVALMMQYYTEPRVVKIVGKDSDWPKYFDFYVSRLDDDKIQYIRRAYKYDPNIESYIPGEYETGEPTAGIFDVKVLSGTSLPFAKTQRANVAFRLFDSKAIDIEELLDALDWPNKDKVMERMGTTGEAQPTEGEMPVGQSGPRGALAPAGAGVTQ